MENGNRYHWSVQERQDNHFQSEVIGFQGLVESANLAEARKHGLLRIEGKNYAVQDGDIITFLFNV